MDLTPDLTPVTSLGWTVNVLTLVRGAVRGQRICRRAGQFRFTENCCQTWNWPEPGADGGEVETGRVGYKTAVFSIKNIRITMFLIVRKTYNKRWKLRKKKTEKRRGKLATSRLGFIFFVKAKKTIRIISIKIFCTWLGATCLESPWWTLKKVEICWLITKTTWRTGISGDSSAGEFQKFKRIHGTWGFCSTG